MLFYLFKKNVAAIIIENLLTPYEKVTITRYDT